MQQLKTILWDYDLYLRQIDLALAYFAKLQASFISWALFIGWKTLNKRKDKLK